MQPGIDPVTKLTEFEYILYYSIQGKNFAMGNKINLISSEEKLEILSP